MLLHFGIGHASDFQQHDICRALNSTRSVIAMNRITTVFLSKELQNMVCGDLPWHMHEACPESIRPHPLKNRDIY